MPGLPFQRLPATQMLAEQEEMEQREVTRWFDSMRFSLDQQELEPEQYQKSYRQLMRQAQQRGLEIKSRHVANAQFLQQLNELVEDGSIAPYQAKKIAYRMAGIQDPEMLRQLSDEPEKIDWTRQYRENVAIQRNLAAFLRNYKVEDGKFYQVDPRTKKIIDKTKPEGPETIRHYNMTLNLLNYYRQQQRDIYTQLYPMEQAALEMERVAVSRIDERPGVLSRLFRHIGTAGVPGTIGVGLIGNALGAEGKTSKEFLWGPEKEESTQRIIRMRKPNTDEMIVSYDGGKTWFKER